MRVRGYWALTVVLGCTRVGSQTDTQTTASSNTGTSESGTRSSGTESTATSGTETTTSSQSETETGEDTGTEDTGGEECPEGMKPCPDGVCVSDFHFWDNACCAHGGECQPGCEPQDAVEVPGECPDGIRYAWDGEACHPICACEGSDCDALYDDLPACLMPHDELCGYYDLSDCFVDPQAMAVAISGKAGGVDVSYTLGVYGEWCDESGIPASVLRFAPDEYNLFNSITAYWWKQDSWSHLNVGVVPFELGPHEKTVRLYGFGEVVEALGTLSVEAFDHGDELELRELVGTLEVVDVDAGWSLSGSFTIGYCGLMDSKI